MCDSEFCKQLAKIGDGDDIGKAIATQLPLGQKFCLGSWDRVRARKRCSTCAFVTRILVQPVITQFLSREDLLDDDLVFALWSSSEFRFQFLKAPTIDDPSPSTFKEALQIGESVLIARVGSEHDETLQVPVVQGRLVRNAQVDCGLIKKWIHLCDTLHGEKCTPRSARWKDLHTRSTKIRLIDTEGQCLVRLPSTAHYLALSYVWGNAEALRLTAECIETFSQPGAFISIRERIPPTIRDAMTFTSQIGERYLWVDSLCLVQDDELDLHRGIEIMDAIYEGAKITLIAANGASANTGLSRLHRDAVLPRQNIAPLNSEFCLIHSIHEELLERNSVWASRGWTLQEKIVSTRCITFVEDRVYFRCQERTWTEGLSADESPLSERQSDIGSALSMLLTMDFDKEYSPFPIVHTLLEAYSLRHLSTEDDTLNAIKSVLIRYCNQMETTLIEGNPANFLEYMILFTRGAWPDRQSKASPRRRESFPSWSWTGWAGSLSWSLLLHVDTFFENAIVTWMHDNCWIDWHICEKNQCRRLTRAANLSRERCRENAKKLFHFTATVMDDQPLFHYEMSANSAHIQYTLLHFFTVSVHLIMIGRLNSPDPCDYFDPSGRSSPNVLDTSDRIVGRIYLDTQVESIDGEVCEMILLCQCGSSFTTLEIFSNTPAAPDDNHFFVLAIDRKDGIVFRKGIGWINASALATALPPGPLWSEIILG